MTKLLEKAIKVVNKLPEKNQNEIAQIILEEINDEKLWEESFKMSQNLLFHLSDEAIGLHKNNNTKELIL